MKPEIPHCACCGKATNRAVYFIGSFPIPTKFEYLCSACNEWAKDLGALL